MAIKIGITGGIGSGKSVVSRLLEVMDTPVYVSDVESKRLTVCDVQIRSKLIALLGEGVYIDGELNRQLLASYIFGNPKNISVVNNIIHPRVREDFRRWAEVRNSFPLLGMESAILFESGFASEVDAVVMVYAPKEIRIERVMQRDSVSIEQVERRISSQMDDEEKRGKADYVIINDGKSPLIPQVLDVVNILTGNYR